MTDLLATELRRRKAAAELNQLLDKTRAQAGGPMKRLRGSPSFN